MVSAYQQLLELDMVELHPHNILLVGDMALLLADLDMALLLVDLDRVELVVEGRQLLVVQDNLEVVPLGGSQADCHQQGGRVLLRNQVVGGSMVEQGKVVGILLRLVLARGDRLWLWSPHKQVGAEFGYSQLILLVCACDGDNNRK